MYVLDTGSFSEFNPTKADAFVKHCSRYHSYDVKKERAEKNIDYFIEINEGHELSQDNIRHLLRWKDPKYLSHTIKSGSNKGTTNPRVMRVLEILDYMNKFRSGTMPVTEFRKITCPLFPNGVIWEIFLFHICRPLEYPIADQHVLRSFDVHTNNRTPLSWEKYNEYRAYFDTLKSNCTKHDGLRELYAVKRVDNALFEFGKFLKNYSA